MTPEELRADVPALERTVYLNTGACGPSPRRVVNAIQSCLRHHEYGAPCEEGMYPAALDVFEEARGAVADLLGASAAEIALTQSTTDGINRIATALEWNPGDVVVRTDLEHSAGVLPWERLRERHGVEVRVLETDRGRLDTEAVKTAVDGAKLVCFSAVDWLFGTRLPVAEVTDIAHDAGALVLVDGVQAPGQTAVDVGEWGADVVAAAGHKWLLGPFGSGFLYVDEDILDRFAPAHVGSGNVEDPDSGDLVYRSDARRFEVGTASPGPYRGLTAAIATIDDVGVDTIEQRIRDLTDRLKAGLDDDRLASPREYESGLVSFTADDPTATVEHLDGLGIRIRALPRPNTVRASVHAFNTRQDVDRLLEGLETA